MSSCICTGFKDINEPRLYVRKVIDRVKADITGNDCHFVIGEGEILKGGVQEVYFCEFDGPAKRTILIRVMGEA